MNDEYRAEATLTGSERAQLEAFVHDNRLEIVGLLDGVTEEQARLRLVPSLTTLLGLVKHVTFAERVWFDVALAGRTRAELGLPEEVDESFTLSDEDTIGSVLAGYRAAWADADATAAALGLDDLAVHNRRGPLTLRWIYLHLIEELARHAGHGDILREQALAAPVSGDHESATQLLHRLTSYEPGRDWDEPLDDPRVLQDLDVNDLARLPLFYKRYPASLPRISLPRDLPTTTSPTVAVLAGTAPVAPVHLDLPQLSRLLHLSAGVVRTKVHPYGTWPFRAAGSAGGRFPLELYVAVPEGFPVPEGVHWYDPQDHALVQVGPPPIAGSPTLVVTGVPWRTGWRYRERGFRHVYWDAGTMLAQLLAAADSAGVPAGLHTRFPDAAVALLTGADRVHEWPVAVVALGAGSPALHATGDASTGAVDVSPVEFPLVTSAQRASDRRALGPAWDRGAAVAVPVPAGAPVEAVVLARGSQRRMDPTRGLSQDLLRTCMQVALRGVTLPHFVVVHDVEELAPGVYLWPDLAAPTRAGALRDELYRVALDQELARDASFVVIAATDVSTLDDRDYREAQLAAGLVEGRLHLAAYSLGASATGMTFLDSEIHGLLGQPLDALLFTCVGVPSYESKPGGAPGSPTQLGIPGNP